MNQHKHSPEYEKIAALILRNDIRTAEKLIQKYEDCLSSQEKEYLAYMMCNRKEVPSERRERQRAERLQARAARRSYKRALSQMKQTGKPGWQYTEIRINI